jgi:uncharacterized protein YdhG (YjbR/CyaY superfamily)
MLMNKPTAFDDYVSDFSVEISERLHQIRTLILSIAPEATESIAYGMPAYKLFGKPMVYVAGFKKHIGFYALSSGDKKFKEQLSEYKQEKGSVQFPHNKSLPYALIEEIIRFRIYELMLLNSQKNE